MELEYRDDRRRGKIIVVVGVIAALVAGGAAYYLLNQAQTQAGNTSLPRVPAVVAVAVIPARQPITAKDVAIRQVPLDDTNANGIVGDAGDWEIYVRVSFFVPWIEATMTEVAKRELNDMLDAK